MNKAILMGRLTRDPELKTTTSGLPVCNFTLAIDRNYKNKDGKKETDFIPIVVWRHNAEFANQYFCKGMRVAVVGKIQPRSYEDQAGEKRYITEVVADEVYFADSKNETPGPAPYQQELPPEPPEDETGLPFDM